jgi:hypothetical protein
MTYHEPTEYNPQAAAFVLHDRQPCNDVWKHAIGYGLVNSVRDGSVEGGTTDVVFQSVDTGFGKFCGIQLVAKFFPLFHFFIGIRMHKRSPASVQLSTPLLE